MAKIVMGDFTAELVNGQWVSETPEFQALLRATQSPMPGPEEGDPEWVWTERARVLGMDVVEWPPEPKVEPNVDY